MLPQWIINGFNHRKHGWNLSIDPFNLTIANKVLIKDSKLTLTAQHQYGLIGVNGSGKSTLLKTLITHPKLQHLRLITIEQEEFTHPEISPFQHVLNSDLEATYLNQYQTELENQLETTDDQTMILDQLDEIETRLRDLDIFKQEYRCQQILLGLGLTEEQIKSPLNQLSGGQQQRVKLACALFCQSDLLLLDEPYNHLDTTGQNWLCDYLKNNRQTLILISHQAEYVAQIATNIIEIENQQLIVFNGQLQQHFFWKQKNQQLNLKSQNKNDKKITKLKKQINEQSTNKQIKKQLSELITSNQTLDPPTEPTQTNHFFYFALSPILNDVLIQTEDLGFNWDETPLFENVSIKIKPESRILLTGDNGTGKTTLIKLLTGQLTPTTGSCQIHPQLRWSMLSQQHIEQLNPKLTPIEYLKQLSPTSSENELRGQLGKFGLKRKFYQLIETLSGGEQSKLALSGLMINQPHLLILDEPTNHLDQQTLQMLRSALFSWNGAVIMITHDSKFSDPSYIKTYWHIDDQELIVST